MFFVVETNCKSDHCLLLCLLVTPGEQGPTGLVLVSLYLAQCTEWSLLTSVTCDVFDMSSVATSLVHSSARFSFQKSGGIYQLPGQLSCIE